MEKHVKVEDRLAGYKVTTNGTQPPEHTQDSRGAIIAFDAIELCQNLKKET